MGQFLFFLHTYPHPKNNDLVENPAERVSARQRHLQSQRDNISCSLSETTSPAVSARQHHLQSQRNSISCRQDNIPCSLSETTSPACEITSPAVSARQHLLQARRHHLQSQRNNITCSLSETTSPRIVYKYLILLKYVHCKMYNLSLSLFSVLLHTDRKIRWKR